MKDGLSKYWTPQAEEHYRQLLASCHSFAERDLIMTIRNLLKYDGRTKESRRSVAQGRLRIATATDEEIREMAELQEQMEGGGGAVAVPDTLEKLRGLRTELGEKGIKGSEIMPPVDLPGQGICRANEAG